MDKLCESCSKKTDICVLEYCEKCFNNVNLNHNTCIDTLDNNNIHHNEILSTSTSEQISDNEDTRTMH